MCNINDEKILNQLKFSWRNLIKLLLQDEIVKKYNAPLNFTEGHYTSLCVEHTDWKKNLHKLENDNEFYVPFVTIPVAAYIERHCKKLAKGFLWPSTYNMFHQNNPLYYNVWSSYIDEKYLLNATPIIKTYKQIKKDYGSDNSNSSNTKVFLRPLSPWKPFTGFDCKEKDICFELKCREIYEHDLIMIFPFKEIDKTEWRCHYFNEKVVSVCQYSWDDNVKFSSNNKEDITEVAKIVGKQLEQVGDAFVIDITNGGKVIEVNAVSTSGWYNGVDIQEIYDNVCEVFEH